MEDFEKQIAKLLTEYFDQIQDIDSFLPALLQAAMQWFRKDGCVENWTSESMAALLIEFHKVYHQSPIAMGQTLERMAYVTIAPTIIERPALQTALTERISGQAAHSRLCIYGPKKSGKRFSVAQVFLSNRKRFKMGAYFWFKDVASYLAIAEQLPESAWIVIEQPTDTALRQQHRLIHFSLNPTEGDDCHEVPYLWHHEIAAYVEAHFKPNAEVHMAHQSFQVKCILSKQLGGLYQAMARPEWLTMLAKHTQHPITPKYPAY